MVALGAGTNVIRLLPPLIIAREDLEQVIEILAEVLA